MRKLRVIGAGAGVLMLSQCFLVTDSCACSIPVPWAIVTGTVTSASGPVPGASVTVIPELYRDTIPIFPAVQTAGDGTYQVEILDLAGGMAHLVIVEPDSTTGLARSEVRFDPPWSNEHADNVVRIDVELQPAPGLEHR